MIQWIWWRTFDFAHQRPSNLKIDRHSLSAVHISTMLLLCYRCIVVFSKENKTNTPLFHVDCSIPRFLEHSKNCWTYIRAWFVWTYTKRPSGQHIISGKPKFIGYILSAFTPPLRPWFSTNTNKQIDYNETHIRSSTALVAIFFLTGFNASPRELHHVHQEITFLQIRPSNQNTHITLIWLRAYECLWNKSKGKVQLQRHCHAPVLVALVHLLAVRATNDQLISPIEETRLTYTKTSSKSTYQYISFVSSIKPVISFACSSG